MLTRFSMLLLAGLMALAGEARAQSGTDVIFTLPLNLTNIAADITKVMVTCMVAGSPQASNPWRTSTELNTEQVFPVLDGRVVTTAMIIVTVPTAPPPGTQMGYGCGLSGFSNRLQRWDQFNESHATDVFRLTPTPADIFATFVW
jgi:hypothetical protein